MATLAQDSPSSSPTRSRKSFARRLERCCCGGLAYFPLAVVYGLTTWAVYVEVSLGLQPGGGRWVGMQILQSDLVWTVHADYVKQDRRHHSSASFCMCWQMSHIRLPCSKVLARLLIPSPTLALDLPGIPLFRRKSLNNRPRSHTPLSQPSRVGGHVIARNVSPSSRIERITAAHAIGVC